MNCKNHCRVFWLILISLSLLRPGNGQNLTATELINGHEVAAGQVLVKFNHSSRFSGTQLADAEAQSVADVTAKNDISEHQILGSISVHLFKSRSIATAKLIKNISARSDVEYVEPNFIVHALRTPNDPDFGSLYGMQKIGAPAAWELSVGTPAIVVGVVDSGIDYNHPDLIANLWSAPRAFTVKIGNQVITCPAGSHGFSAITNTCDPFDSNQHGTHVSGTIGASGNNGQGVTGINWSTALMASQFLDSTGSGTNAGAINAIDFTLQVKVALGAAANVRILNNSWGNLPFSQALLDEINTAAADDVLFVAAAGNTGTNNDVIPQYPASYAAGNIISVAATDSNDQLASFSNFGPSTVHLGAPGVQILSTLPGGNYGPLDGTSMAAPHVAGAAALILSRCNLSTQQLKTIILQNVDVVSSLVQKTATGGRLNVDKAIRSCLPSPVGAFASQIDSTTQSLEVYFTASDQHTQQWTWNPSNGWLNTDLTTVSGALNSTPNGPVSTIVDTFLSEPEVYYVGTDQHVHQFFETSGTWHTADISALTGAPASATSVKSLTALMDTITGRPEAYYAGQDQHVHQLYFDTNGWHTADISVSSGAPNVASGGTVTSMVNTLTGAPEIWYVGQDQHIHVIAFNSTAGWEAFDITSQSGAPGAASTAGVTILIDSVTSRAETYFNGTDGHVHQLYWVPGICWCTSDLTTVTGAPPAAGGASITSLVDSLSSQLEIYYVSSNQHIWQIGWSPQRNFFTLDVTGFTGAPNALSGTTLTALVNTLDNALEVYYVASDSHMHQLQWTAATGWRQFDISRSN